MANATPGNNTNATPSNNTNATLGRNTGVTQTSENLNESTPMSQRDPIGKFPKTEGPKMGENGNYEQAEYPLGKGISRRDR